MQHQNFINNQWRDAENGKTFQVDNPFTEDVLASVPASDEVDINNAVEAAKAAFWDWRRLTADERKGYLLSLIHISEPTRPY